MVAIGFSLFLELAAFLIGIYYYRRNKSRPTLFLVWFLGITFFSEFTSLYAFFVNDGFLSFLKGSAFESNYWSSNIYSVISFLFYINYFKFFLSSKRKIAILNIVSIIFILQGIFEFFLSDSFFVRFMPVSTIVGTLFIFMSIAFYYLELLKSDQILQVHRSLPFYISVGALIFHLCTTPLFLYGIYYSNSIDPDFVSLYRQFIFGINYLLYAIYIAGFLICLRRTVPYFPRKSY